jgi:hypothetical protein
MPQVFNLSRIHIYSILLHAITTRKCSHCRPLVQEASILGLIFLLVQNIAPSRCGATERESFFACTLTASYPCVWEITWNTSAWSCFETLAFYPVTQTFPCWIQFTSLVYHTATFRLDYGEGVEASCQHITTFDWLLESRNFLHFHGSAKFWNLFWFFSKE